MCALTDRLNAEVRIPVRKTPRCYVTGYVEVNMDTQRVKTSLGSVMDLNGGGD